MPIINDNPDETLDLDVSWINEQHRIQNIETNYSREPITDIHIYSLYINKNSVIDKITRKKQAVTNNVLTQDVVLNIIQTNKHANAKRYKLMDILLYHVDLEPEHIQNYSQTSDIPTSSKSFFKVIPVLGDIGIPPSIFIFHSINSVFFVYKELDTGSHNHTIKSILKQSTSTEPKHTHTKKVRISLDTQEQEYIPHRIMKPKKTRKKLYSISK